MVRAICPLRVFLRQLDLVGGEAVEVIDVVAVNPEPSNADLNLIHAQCLPGMSFGKFYIKTASLRGPRLTAILD
jgi:hypothetical protein